MMKILIFKPLPFSFDRASSATVINKDGLIETVGSGEPRIDYLNDSKGALLLEPSRSNVITYSEDFNAVGNNWEKVSITIEDSDIISPNGTQNAFKLLRPNDTSSAWIRKRPIVVVGQNQVISMFAKSGSNTVFNITYYDTEDGDRFFNFDLSTKVVSGNGLTNDTYVDSGIKDYGNGWFRCYVIIEAGLTNPQIQFGVGENRVGLPNEYLYVYAPQLEQGNYATSYIPTSGGVVTRVTDVLPITELRSKNILGSVSFSYLFDFTHQGGGTFSGFFNEVDDASLYKGGWVESGGLQYRTPIGGGNYYVNVKVPITSGDRVKCCVTLNGSTRKIYANGVLISTLNNCDNLSNDIDGFIQYYGNTNVNYESYRYNGLQVYNTELTDTEAIALTTI